MSADDALGAWEAVGVLWGAILCNGSAGHSPVHTGKALEKKFVTTTHANVVDFMGCMRNSPLPDELQC